MDRRKDLCNWDKELYGAMVSDIWRSTPTIF